MLKTAIQEAQKRRKADARQKYIALVVAGTDPEAILTAASEAGISAEQVERDADLIGRAAELGETAKALPGLLKRLPAATARLQKAHDVFERSIGPLQAEIDSAAAELSAIDRDVSESRAAAVEEWGLHREHPQFIPALSAGGQHVATCNSKATEREAASRRFNLASAKVQRIRAKLQHAQAVLNTTGSGLNSAMFPTAQDSPAAAIARADVENYTNDLAAALAEQAAAEQELTKLETRV